MRWPMKLLKLAYTGAIQLLEHIKSLLKAGLFTALPLTLTILILKFLYTTFQYWLKPFGLTSIILIFCSLLIIGFLGQFILSEAIIHPLERIIDRIPLIRVFYFSIKSIVDFFNLTDNNAQPRKVVLVEYPGPETYHLGFSLGNAHKDFSKLVAQSHPNTEYTKVFMPSTQITIGFFLIVPRNKTIETELTFEEAVKALVSGGLITPQSLQEQQNKKRTQDP